MHKLRDSPGSAEEDLRSRIEAVAGKGRIYVLGLGNTDRGDDGAGILVAEALKKPFPDYSFSEHDGIEGTVLDISERMEDSTILFVDAADMGLEPGSLRLIPRESIKETEITTHRVAVALMSSILEKSGKMTAVVAVQPLGIEFRSPVSRPVKRAVDAVVAILRESMGARDA